jgi:hypothetical protein
MLLVSPKASTHTIHVVCSLEKVVGFRSMAFSSSQKATLNMWHGFVLSETDTIRVHVFGEFDPNFSITFWHNFFPSKKITVYLDVRSQIFSRCNQCVAGIRISHELMDGLPFLEKADLEFMLLCCSKTINKRRMCLLEVSKKRTYENQMLPDHEDRTITRNGYECVSKA